MEILNVILTAIAALLGLPVGFFLAYIAKEELKSGENYFIWMQEIILIAAINLFFYSIGLRWPIAIAVLIITAGLVFNFRPGEIISYVILGILFVLSVNNNALLLVISSAAFLYSLPTAAVLKLEGIRELKYPLHYLAKRLIIIGHRGAPEYEAENTLSSFKKAIDLGVDMLEVDVRMTKDKKLIIMHDSTVNRTTNGKGYVKNMLYKDIKKLKAKNKEKVPSLQEVLELAKKEKCELNLHLKDDAADQVIRLLKKNRMLGKVLISSFSEKTLKRIKELAPDIKTAYLFSKPTPFYIETAKKLGAYALHPNYNILTRRVVSRAHKKNMRVNVWPVGDKKSALKAKLYYSVDGLITDDPLLYSKRKRKKILGFW